jgi:hypothetical protein
MSIGFLNAIQALVEYGGASGNAPAGAAPINNGSGQLVTWIGDHQTGIAIAAAGFVLLWLVRASTR